MITRFSGFASRPFKLARLDVEEYRKGVGPVGAALGALMDSSRTRERAELKASLLLQVIESGFDEARQLLLANLIETYLELSPDERKRYRKMVARKEYRKVQDVDQTWMDKLLSQGEKKGREAGRQVGHEVGRQELEVRIVKQHHWRTHLSAFESFVAVYSPSNPTRDARRGALRALRLRISNRLSPSVQTDPSHHRLNDSLDVGHEPHRSHQSESPNPCVRKRVGEQRCGGKKRRPLRDNIIDDRNVAGID